MAEKASKPMTDEDHARTMGTTLEQFLAWRSGYTERFRVASNVMLNQARSGKTPEPVQVTFDLTTGRTLEVK